VARNHERHHRRHEHLEPAGSHLDGAREPRALPSPLDRVGDSRLQPGEVGSTGAATAISQGMDVELFWILEDIAAAEPGAGAVLREGLEAATWLIGQRREASVISPSICFSAISS